VQNLVGDGGAVPQRHRAAERVIDSAQIDLDPQAVGGDGQ
jgi:hypothetical protein